MLEQNKVIENPTYGYFSDQVEVERMQERKMVQAQVAQLPFKVVKYRSRAQIANEQEELAIAGEYDKQLNVKKLAELLREGDMKEFYKVANKVLMIRTSNPVVRRLRIGNEGEEEIIEDRVLVEEEVSKYFKTMLIEDLFN